ncbi:MAG: hypothetical protein LBL62_00025 [Planctomycetaceae bacterium]|jgi:hypothetical protein|nr:hypothetical protein [Planctomycetaceae bacterium]
MANNPVKRLYDIVVLLRKNRNETVTNAFAKILQIENLGEHYPVFFRRVSIVYSLIEAAKIAVDKINSKDYDYSRSIKVISKALQSLNWQDIVANTTLGQINEADIKDLEMTAARVSELGIEKEISEEDIDSIIKQIDTFVKEVTEMQGLPENLKAFILERLDALRSAVVFYQYSGSASIETATDAMLGVIVRNYLFHSKEKTTTSIVKEVATKICKLATDIYLLISVTNDLVQIPESVQTILKLLP